MLLNGSPLPISQLPNGQQVTTVLSQLIGSGQPLSILQGLSGQQVKPIEMVMNGLQIPNSLNGQQYPAKGDTNSESGSKKTVKLVATIPPAKKENVDKFNVNSKPAPPIKLTAVKKHKITDLE